MGRLDITAKAKELFDKYKFVLAVLGIGILLMLIPDNDKPQAPSCNAFSIISRLRPLSSS